MIPIVELAEQWLAQDCDLATRQEIVDLLQANNVPELESRLRHPIAFGTAGLRSSMKAGFAHMNALTVLRASQGLAQYIKAQHPAAGIGELSVVIGHDARHNSDRFARLAAAAFLESGLSVLWHGELVHTPMVPFAVKRYGATAGVMVTASHNPKNDNGYKVYWNNGCQIIPPHDVGIAQAIEGVKDMITWDNALVDRHERVKRITAESVDSYCTTLADLVGPRASSSRKPIAFAYTAMHGVGLPFMKRAVGLFGDQVVMHVVSAQAKPDPDFPTVPFPNPEEKGALTPAIHDAESAGCALILANDPDADRFAAVERLQDGSWHQFTGNQMGVLLASHIYETYGHGREQLVMLASTVSSRMLATIAAKEGFHFRETLTGFKWLGNVARQLEKEGYKAVFAYEEAIGYMMSNIVWDKDGVAAATLFLKACLSWSKQGLTPWSKLQNLYAKYGFFEDANTYLISPSPAITTKAFSDIRVSNAGARPESVGTRKILRWRDLTLGFDTGTTDTKPDLPVDASAQMITCELDSVVFTVRGSGTEPKIKLYIEAQAGDAQTARTKADEVLQDLLGEWFKPEYGLRLAGT